MVKLNLMIKMEVDNVTEIIPADDFGFMMKIQCTSCREEHENAVTMDPKEERELSSSRGTANFVWRCPHCKKEHSATFIPPSSSSKSLILPYTSLTSQSSPLLTLDCRGLEPLSFLFTNGTGGSWTAKALKEDEEEGGKKGGSGKDAEFVFELDEEGRWDDYDEANAREVGVRELEAKWVKTK